MPRDHSMKKYGYQIRRRVYSYEKEHEEFDPAFFRFLGKIQKYFLTEDDVDNLPNKTPLWVMVEQGWDTTNVMLKGSKNWNKDVAPYIHTGPGGLARVGQDHVVLLRDAGRFIVPELD